jgi:hypothetical protein
MWRQLAGKRPKGQAPITMVTQTTQEPPLRLLMQHLRQEPAKPSIRAPDNK